VRKKFVVFLTLFAGISLTSNILKAMDIFEAAKQGDTLDLRNLASKKTLM